MILAIDLSPATNFNIISALTYVAMLLEALSIWPFLNWKSRSLFLVLVGWMGLNEWLDFTAMPPLIQPMPVMYPASKRI
ncbi:MAG: hypothetical protein ACFFCZ_10365 [Promethearchaeota archaeon]